MKKIRSGVFLILLLALITLAACNSETHRKFQKMEDFADSRIGLLTGTSFDVLAKEHFPQAQRLYSNNIADWILNLQQGKVDGNLMDLGFFTPLQWENSGLAYIEMNMPPTEYAVAFPKTAEAALLQEQFNGFLRQCRESGWLAAQEEKWLSDSEPDGSLDFSLLTGENGVLRVGTTVECKPFNYLKNGVFCGFDADLLFQFAKQYGYGLEIDMTVFGGLLPGLSADRYDLVIAGLTVTEERKQSVLFSDTYCSCPVVMAVPAESVVGPEELTLADLEEGTLGIVTGTSWDLVAQREFPNAERKYFPSSTDVVLAVKQGKVDAFFADKTVFAGMAWENSALACIDEPLEEISNALILSKDGYDNALLAELNTFIAKAKGDGTLDRLSEKWFGLSEPEEHPDYRSLTGQNGTLKIAIGDSMRPTAYQKGSQYTGYEVDFLTLFAQEYGYKLEMHGMSFEALIPSVASGRCDIGACGITITAERAESVTFTDPHFETYGVAVIKDEAAESSKVTLEDFENATIGILTGSVYDKIVKERFPDAERQYYTLSSDMVFAVEQGKIDGYISESTYVTAALWEGAKIRPVEEVLAQSNAGYIFPKDSEKVEVQQQLNTFIRQAKETGMLEQLRKKWLESEEPTELFDHSSLTGENGTLKVAIAPDMKPLGYIKDGKVVGYEVEVLQLFAKEYGYDLEFHYMTFDAILPGVVSGKYDIGAGGVTITEERAESVDFSESYLTVDVVMITGAEQPAEQTGFWDEIWESFEKTFIREGRWELILDGTVVTMLISLCATIAGTLLGFGLYMLSQVDVKPVQALARAFGKVYSRIVAGTPAVVVLMILFYVVFEKSRDISGTMVAMIGFGLIFGAFVYDHMTVSVSSVDRGQVEAAYALGYTRNKTFFRIVLPQAMHIFLPTYCGQAVELIKGTAVVGYIAVNDLTKMGDIIRSNTYEAFFPLIATAVIYFMLTWLLALLLGLVRLHFEPRRRKKEKILKGVKSL